jgi:hypothetical protein
MGQAERRDEKKLLKGNLKGAWIIIFALASMLDTFFGMHPDG